MYWEWLHMYKKWIPGHFLSSHMASKWGQSYDVYEMNCYEVKGHSWIVTTAILKLQ